MAGEISPDIMFCDNTQIVSQMGEHGCTWASIRCEWMYKQRGNEKQGKKTHNARVGYVFECVFRGKKSIKFSGMVMMVREDHWGGMVAPKLVCDNCRCS